MKRLLIISLLPLLSFSVKAQSCNPDSLQTIITRTNLTDPNIPFELKKHYSFYNPTCFSHNTLLIHLGGSFGQPKNYLLFPKLAANNGFHVISLHYPNTIAAKTACGNSTDTNCFIKYRNEILEGIDYSTQVSVDAGNCIYNRIIKLLQYLHANNPSHNWNSFYSGNTVNWNKIMISGHSQGGGHAAVIGKDNPVKRVIMFASPNDYSNILNIPAAWTLRPKITPDSSYYGFVNLHDNVVNSVEQFQIWKNLGMSAYGDTTNVDTVSFPYTNSRQLYTTVVDTVATANHSLMIVDAYIPLVDGISVFEPEWKYLLGITNSVSIPKNKNALSFSLYPNPAQDNLVIDCNTKINKITIHTMSGRVVLKQKKTNNSIDIKELNPGMYVLTIELDDKMSTKKFVKN